MEMEVNGIVRNVIDVQIVFSDMKVLKKYWYFIQVKYYSEIYGYDWEIIEGYENPRDAVNRAIEIQTSIASENN